MSSVVKSTADGRKMSSIGLCAGSGQHIVAKSTADVQAYSKYKLHYEIYLRHGYDDEDDEKSQVQHVVFRRLSQTTQTDALLGHMDMSNTHGRLIIRPKSVQERIRELNLKARQFADTFIAIQAGNGHAGQAMTRNYAIHSANSTQCSPWNSPRILSPIDAKHFCMSKSTENLTHIPSDGSPSRVKWKRRSLKKKKKQEEENEDPDGAIQRRRIAEEAQQMYRDTREELKTRLEHLANRGRVLTPYEAKSLVALLYSEDTTLIEKSLVTIANCAAFSVNLEFYTYILLGCVSKDSIFFNQRMPDIQTAKMSSLGLILLTHQLLRYISECLPHLMKYVDGEDDALCLASLVVLTNIATISEWHDVYCPLLHRLYHLVDKENPHIQLQSLRLLVNLSCNKDMIPSLLAAEGPHKLSTLVVSTTQDSVLLRVLTLLSALAHAVKEDRLDPTHLPPEDKAAAPD
ncbi:unnamed protein product, partial [Meganyctiphanes norvegica]